MRLQGLHGFKAVPLAQGKCLSGSVFCICSKIQAIANLQQFFFLRHPDKAVRGLNPLPIRYSKLLYDRRFQLQSLCIWPSPAPPAPPRIRHLLRLQKFGIWLVRQTQAWFLEAFNLPHQSAVRILPHETSSRIELECAEWCIVIYMNTE